MVSSRSGLVDSSVISSSISSSRQRVNLTAAAGSCAQLRAPQVLFCYPRNGPEPTRVM